MVQKTDRDGDEKSDSKKRVRSVTQKQLIPVKAIEQQGKSVLVEWLDDGRIRRCIIPQARTGTEVGADVLSAGVAYGEKWSEIEGVNDDLEQELYRQGIWGKSDLLKLSHRARGAVERILCAPVVSKLLRFAQEV